MTDILTFAPPTGGNAAGFSSALQQYLWVASNSGFVVSAGQDFAVAGWVKPTTASGNNRIFSKWGGQAVIDDWLLQIDNTGSNYQLATVAADRTTFTLCTSAGGVTTGAWSFLYGDFDHTTGAVRLSVNNGAFATQTGPTSVNGSTTDVVVGSDATHSFFLNGVVDALAFWKRKLTSGEITALYNSGNGVRLSTAPASVQTGLVSWWEMENDTGTGWLDSFGTNHLTSVNGVASVVGKT